MFALRMRLRKQNANIFSGRSYGESLDWINKKINKSASFYFFNDFFQCIYLFIFFFSWSIHLALEFLFGVSMSLNGAKKLTVNQDILSLVFFICVDFIGTLKLVVHVLINCIIRHTKGLNKAYFVVMNLPETVVVKITSCNSKVVSLLCNNVNATQCV